jgi:hypothetical protein
LAALLLVLPGCGRGADTAAEAASEVSIREAVTEADPDAAVEEIYETLPDAQAVPLSAFQLANYFPELSLDDLLSYTGRISSPEGGLADLIFFEPAEGKRDTVREALRGYQERRIREFEDYDILGSFEIAANATVIDQGDFVILLMLADNEVVRDIIDKYIPL